MEGNEDVKNYHLDDHHSEKKPFQLGSIIDIGPIMVKREFVSMEREGIVEEPYQEIDFSQANFDDDINIIPDEDPLSCDQLNRHRHVVDRRKKADKVVSTFNVIMGLPPESGEVQALKNPFKRGRKKRKVGSFNESVDEIDEIEAVINENESTLENEASEKKVKLELVGTPANPNTKTDQDSITSKTLRVSRRTRLCTICNVGFPNEQFYILHVKAKHADKFPHACRHCGKRFAKFDEKKKHETIHDPNRFKGEPKFACDFCDKKYHIKVSLEGHRKVAHLGYIKPKRKRLSVPVTQHHARGIRRPEPEVKVEKVLYPCTECDLKFDFRFKLKRHMRVHTGETPFSCEICHQPFKFVSGLRHHIKVVHENPTNNPRRSRPKFMANQPCPCEICGRVFKVPSHLTKHMTLHTGEKNYECNICGKHFRISQDLKLHQRRHTLKESNRKPFKCRYCGNRYIMFNELNNHRIGKHRDIPYPDNRDMEKSFGCGICGKPYHLEEQAMVCAILGHDPTTLRDAMFKHKCPECPEDRFGYHQRCKLVSPNRTEPNH